MKTLFGSGLAALCTGLGITLLAGVGTVADAATPTVNIPMETAQPALLMMLPSAVAKSKTMTVAVALGSPPDDFRNDKDQIVGWEIDILNGVAQSLGLKLALRATTFDSVMPGLQAKRFDAAVGQMGVTAAREKVVDMVGTLTGNELFAARVKENIKVNSLMDICGHSIAITRGSREYEFAKQQQPKCKTAGKPPIKIEVYNDGTSASNALMSGRANLFWIGSTAISYFVHQSDGRAKVVGQYTDKSYIGIALPKNSGLAEPVQAAVQHLIDDGTYAKIIKKWGLEDGAIKKAPLNPTGTPT